jgi:hypothetical protein
MLNGSSSVPVARILRGNARYAIVSSGVSRAGVVLNGGEHQDDPQDDGCSASDVPHRGGRVARCRRAREPCMSLCRDADEDDAKQARVRRERQHAERATDRDYRRQAPCKAQSDIDWLIGKRDGRQ